MHRRIGGGWSGIGVLGWGMTQSSPSSKSIPEISSKYLARFATILVIGDYSKKQVKYINYSYSRG